jgi:hypothetical protein
VVSFDLSDGIAVLERTPAAFRALLEGLPECWVRTDEGPGTFTPIDNIGHLIHGERADWIPRARIILAQGSDRRFTPFDRFAQVRESEGKSLDELMDEFARLRAENLATLRGWHLSELELALEGEHPAFGPVTLRQLLATWVAHDLGHIAHVGPWRAYLPVLDRGGPHQGIG